MWNFGQGQTTEPHTHFLVIQQFLQPCPYPFSYSSLPTPLITQTSSSVQLSDYYLFYQHDSSPLSFLNLSKSLQTKKKKTNK